MKRPSLVLPVVLFILATASPVLAQTTLSLTGGLNRTTMTADPPDGIVWRSESLTRMSVGLAATFPASERIGLQLGVAYAQKGGRLSGLDGDILVTTEIALDYFEFSLLAVPTFPYGVMGPLRRPVLRRSHLGEPDRLRLRRVGPARSGAGHRLRRLRRWWPRRGRGHDGPRGRRGRRHRGRRDGAGERELRPAVHARAHSHRRGRLVLERTEATCPDASDGRGPSDRIGLSSGKGATVRPRSMADGIRVLAEMGGHLDFSAH